MLGAALIARPTAAAAIISAALLLPLLLLAAWAVTRYCRAPASPAAPPKAPATLRYTPNVRGPFQGGSFQADPFQADPQQVRPAAAAPPQARYAAPARWLLPENEAEASSPGEGGLSVGGDELSTGLPSPRPNPILHLCPYPSPSPSP